MSDLRSLPSPEQHVRTLIAQLELMSHVNAVNLDSNGGRSSDDEPGGKRPTGGIDTRDDLTQDSALKSHVYYRRRLARCHTTGQLEHLARDIEATIRAWEHPPKPPRDSEPWQQLVARDTRKSALVAEEWNISRAYVRLLRLKYADKAA